MTIMPPPIPCRVCGEPAPPLFEGQLLGRRVQYHECGRCAYVQTETPNWLEQAYSQAINRSDTGILKRNQRNARLVVRTLALLGRLREPVIDSAGGYGLLVRLLRDAGVDACWSDPYCDNLVARGFEYQPGSPRAALVTAFEALEHYVDPIAEIARLCGLADAVLVSTDLIPTPAPQPGLWWYYAPEHGQHIGFYRLATLRYIAQRLGWHVVSDGKSFHLFSARPIAAWRWWLAKRTAAWAPLIARLRLRSKTWDDHRAVQQLP